MVKIVHCSYSQYARHYDRFRAGETPPAFDPEKSGGEPPCSGIPVLHRLHPPPGLERLHGAAGPEHCRQRGADGGASCLRDRLCRGPEVISESIKTLEELFNGFWYQREINVVSV